MSSVTELSQKEAAPGAYMTRWFVGGMAVSATVACWASGQPGGGLYCGGGLAGGKGGGSGLIGGGAGVFWSYGGLVVN